MKPSPNVSPVPLHGDACEAFARNASLRVDRELGRAEQAVLDMHLATCRNCRERAHEAELVSRALKHWDAERVSVVHAPARLRQSIRSMVEVEGARRRREFRHVRANAFAMAAAVLLALGAGVFFGLPSSSGELAGDLTLADVGAPSPTLTAIPVPSPAPHVPLGAVGQEPAPLQTLGHAEVPAVAWIGANELGAFAEAVRYLALEPDERDFYAGTGEQGIRWEMPDGRSGLISAGALACIRTRGQGSIEGYLAALAERTGSVREPGHVYGVEPVAVLSTRGVSDVLPLGADRDSVEGFLGRQDLVLGGGRLRLHAIEGKASVDPSVRFVFDLERAFRYSLNHVALEEGGGDDLVMIVSGTRHPIFIPAGELLQGGRVDRVVRHNVWIPAVQGEDRFEIPCVAVSTEGGSTAGRPRPTGLMAGPRLRRLLADGASAEKVSAFVDGLVRARSLDFSLLARLPLPEARVLKQRHADVFQQLGWRGFGVTDARGRLAGIEITGLGPEASADLLARVALGYELEDALRRSNPAEAQAASGTIVPARVTLMNLLAYGGRLRVPAGESGALRRATLRDARSDMVVEVFERAPGGAVLFLSALASEAP